MISSNNNSISRRPNSTAAVLRLKVLAVVVVVVLDLVASVEGGDLPLPVLASRAKSRHVSADAFRKGHRTRLADVIEQDDLDESVRAYRRAATGSVADRRADIALSPVGEYVADGAQRYGHSGEFDHGQLTVNRSRTVQQAGDVISAGIDTGAQVDKRANLAQIGAVPGVVSAGAGTALDRVGRRQDLSDAEHMDQYVKAALLDEERYDRGVKNSASESQAALAAGGLASGSSSANFAATRDRAAFVNTIPDAGITVDQRHVRKADRIVNDMAATKAGDSAVVFGPLAAAGRERGLEDVRTHQVATHHGLVAEQHTFDAPVERHLQSDWVKGQAASQAAIDAVTGAASGSGSKQLVSGFDQADTLITIANRARKQSATESAEFDDRHGVRQADSKSVIV